MGIGSSKNANNGIKRYQIVLQKITVKLNSRFSDRIFLWLIDVNVLSVGLKSGLSDTIGPLNPP